MELENEFEKRTKKPLTDNDLRLINVAQKFLSKYGIFKTKETFDTPVIDYSLLKERRSELL